MSFNWNAIGKRVAIVKNIKSYEKKAMAVKKPRSSLRIKKVTTPRNQYEKTIQEKKPYSLPC